MMPDVAVLRLLTPDVRAMIWAAKEPLSEATPGYATVNYLFDGLIKSHLQTQKELHQVTFIHQLDGENFWLGFVDGSGSVEDFMKSFVGIIPEKSREKLLILGSEHLPSSWDKPLDKAFGFVERI